MLIIHNGVFINNDQYIDADNRAYKYGDAIFETIKFINGTPLFFVDHFDRLITGMRMLNISIPDYFSIDFFLKQFTQIAEKNNCEASARIRLQVYRNASGFYLPHDNQCAYTITAHPLISDKYILNTQPLTIDFYNENIKAKSPISNLKSANALIYILAAQFASAHNFDDCYILNSDSFIIETISSNIFIYTNNQFITPSIADGCIAGVMRKQFIKSAKALNVTLIEKSIDKNDLLNAEEIVLTNVIQGIKLVKCNSSLTPLLQQLTDAIIEK